MTLIKIALMVYLVCVAAASAQPGIVYAPPDPSDNSCEARATRMYPWASQNRQRTEMLMALCMQDRVTSGAAQGCVTTRTRFTETTVCSAPGAAESVGSK